MNPASKDALMQSKGFLNSCFQYDPGSGSLLWKNRPEMRPNWNAARAGKEAGRINKRGYRSVGVRWFGKDFHVVVHRVCFLLHHGFLTNVIDHIDGNKLNNRAENLRPASKAINSWNSKVRKDSKSGVKGVKIRKSRSSKHSKGVFYYESRIQHLGVVQYLGSFSSLELAAKAYQDREQELRGEFCRGGKK